MTDPVALPKFIQIEPHAEDCCAVQEVRRGYWRSPWAWACPETDWGTYDRSGRPMGRRKGRGRIRLIVPCNDPGCRARLLVDEMVLEDALRGEEE
jgi:hypothetical protein